MCLQCEELILEEAASYLQTWKQLEGDTTAVSTGQESRWKKIGVIVALEKQHETGFRDVLHLTQLDAFWTAL